MFGSHRAQARFGRAKWRKRLLLPCWAAQVLILLSLMVLFSYRLSRTANTWKDEEDKGDVPMVEFVWESVNIGFSFISLILTFISIAKFISEVLTPIGMLFNNILNAILSLAVLALDILVYVRRADKQYSLIGLGLDCGLLLCTFITACYALVVYRRLAAYDDYHIPGNVKPYGYDAAAYPSTAYPSMLEAPRPYDPTDPSAGRYVPLQGRSLSALSLSVNSRVSSSRRVSGSYMPLQQHQQHQQPARPPAGGERRTSYDHKRSTQFDEYVARRLSGHGSATNLKNSVDRALGSEFGWTEGAGGAGPRDSVVSIGSVAAAPTPVHPRPGGGTSLGSRRASWDAAPSPPASEAGAAAPSRELSVTSGITMAHSLVSVPEAHEETEAHHDSSSGGSPTVLEKPEYVEIELGGRKRESEL